MAFDGEKNSFTAFKALSRIIGYPILLFDSVGMLEYASKEACHLLATENQAELQERWNDFKPLFSSGLSDIRKRPELRSVQFAIFPLEDISPLSVEIFNVSNNDGYIALLRESGKVNLVENTLLLGTQMQAISYLFGALLHDLKAPLNTMQITVELMSTFPSIGVKKSGEINSEQETHQRYINVLQEEIKRLNRLMQLSAEPLLPPSNKEVQHFDLREPLQGVINLIQPQAKRQRVVIETNIPNTAINLKGSLPQFKSMLLSVASNRLKVIASGGHLKIEISVASNSVEIIFQDTGRHIDEDFIDSIYPLKAVNYGSDDTIYLQMANLVAKTFNGALRIDNAIEGRSSILISISLD